MRKAYLVLENGRVFEGCRFGAVGEATGEAVFTTAMVGYSKTLTDPSHEGQIVVQTFPLIGNYGVIPAEFESDGPRLSAYIVREWCEQPSNFRSQGNVDDYLRACGVPGLCQVDTRALTRLLRTAGSMRAKLSDTPSASFEGADGAAARAGAGQIAAMTPENARFRVALWDFGARAEIARALMSRGCEIVPFPKDASAEAVLAARPDGIVLAGGPGDPAAYAGAVTQVAAAARAGTPMLGVCLGHLLLALSQGAKAEKLRFGHRGANQPVRDARTGRIYITSQNHGHVVSPDGLPASMEITFTNENDGSLEGLAYKDFPALSAQFYPEASAGSHSTGFLLDQFIAMLGR